MSQAACNSNSDCLSTNNFGCSDTGMCMCNSNYDWDPNMNACIQSNRSNKYCFSSLNMDCSSSGVCECTTNYVWDNNLFGCFFQNTTVQPTKKTTVLTTSSTPVTAPLPNPFTLNFIGCYADVINSSARDLNGLGNIANKIGGTSIEACVNLCSYMNFKYAGLQSGYAF